MSPRFSYLLLLPPRLPNLRRDHPDGGAAPEDLQKCQVINSAELLTAGAASYQAHVERADADHQDGQDVGHQKDAHVVPRKVRSEGSRNERGLDALVLYFIA